MKFVPNLTAVGSRIFILRLMLLVIGIDFTRTSLAFTCSNTNFVKDDLLCDGINNCGDRSDEESCLSCTGNNSFHCTWSLECVRKENHCDGKPDCRDDSDETSCPCRDEEFTCTNSDCIRLTNLCDGKKDCTDGFDEKNCSNCTSGAVHCARSQECLPEGVDLENYPNCLVETTVGPDKLLEVNKTNNNNGTLLEFPYCSNNGKGLIYFQVCDGINDCPDGSDELNCYNNSNNNNNINCTAEEFYCAKSGNCITKNAHLAERSGCFEFENVTVTTLGETRKTVVLCCCILLVVILVTIVGLARFQDSKYRYSSRVRNCWDWSKILCLCCPSVKFLWAAKLTKSCRPVWTTILHKNESEIPGQDALLVHVPNDSTPMILTSPSIVLAVEDEEIMLQKELRKSENVDDALHEFLKHFLISCNASSSSHLRREIIFSVPCSMRPLTATPLVNGKPHEFEFYESLGTEIFTLYKGHILAWVDACPKNETLVQDLGEYAGKACLRELVAAGKDGPAKIEEIPKRFVEVHREFKKSIFDKILDKDYNIRLFFSPPPSKT